MIILVGTFGTFSIDKINSEIGDATLAAKETGTANPYHFALLMASIALMAAVCSKSGQFPLHTWLPDAMAAPRRSPH